MALPGLPSSDRLIERERLLNGFLPGSRALAICRYDRRRLEPALLVDVLRAHPHVAIGTEVVGNPYRLPPQESSSGGDPAADLGRWMRDLADVVRDEKALRSAAEHTDELVGAMRVGFSMLDVNGVHLRVNPALCAMTGFAEDELVGVGPPHPYWPPEERAAIADAFEQTMAGVGRDFELTFTRKDGTRFPVLVTPSVVRDANGRPEVVFATVRDETDRRAAAEQLARTAREWEATFDAVSDAIWLLDGEQRVVRSNRAADETFGRAEEGAIGHHCWEIVHGATGPIAGCPVFRARTTLRRESMDLEIGARWFQVTADPIVDEAGGFAGAVHLVSDITERRQAEESLRQSEERFRLTFDHGPFGAVVAGLDRRIQRANDEFARMTGYPPEEIVGLPLERITHPDDAATDVAGVRRLVAGEADRYERDERYVRRDGSVAWGHVIVRLLHDVLGRPLAFLAMIDDISDRHAAEEALRESEARYRSLFTNLQSGLARCRMEWEDGRPVDWTYLAVNDTHEAQTGLHDVVGRRVSDLVPGIRDANPDVFAACGRVAVGGPPERFETYVPGLEAWYGVSAYSQAPDEFVAVFDDITERKRSEVELRQREADLAEAQRIAHVGSWRWDPATDAVEWSDELFRIFGLEVAAHAPSFVEHQRMYTDETRGALLAAVARAVDDGQAYEVPLDVVRPDGEIRHVISRGEAVRGPGGSIAGLRGTVIDRTDRRDAEMRLLRAQRIETVGRLAGGVAHDFNNLLAIITGNAELARAGLAEEDPRAVALAEVDYAARRGAALTRQLLSFSQQQIVAPVVFEIDHAVGEMVRILRRLIRESITLTFVAGGPAGRVRADRAQVGQILLNLAVNARDAMPDGGALRIETGVADLAGADPRRPASLEPGRYATVTLTDTGRGIDPEARVHLFEPFFTTKGVNDGSGLGLSTAQGIARQGGGDLVLVDSTPGGGSSFTLYLPAVEDPLPVPLPATTAEAATGTRAILLVEDDAAVRRLAQRILTDAGYTVLVAADGAEALALLAGHPDPVDLVFSDVITPEMGGVELAARVAETRPGTAVLLMSGYPGDIVAQGRTMPMGAHFIGKPFTASELIAKVHEAIGG